MQYNDEKCEYCGSFGKFNKETVLKVSQCFSTYLDGLFCDLSKTIMKRLEEQQQKIVKNQKLLINLSKVLLSRSHCSSTSLRETERQNQGIQTERKRISSFKQAKDLMTVQKISQTLIKMQANLLYLQGSLRRLPESQVVKATQRQIQQHISKNSPTSKGNKMPLISKVSHLLHQLLPLCQDEDDTSVIKFHLKKTYGQINEIIQHHQQKQPAQSNVLIEQNHRQNVPRQFFTTEYFSEKSFSKQSLVQQQQNLQNTKFGQSSIVANLPATSGSNMNSVKENYSSNKLKSMKQHDYSSVQSYSIAKNNVTETICSIRKPKYFQRTSNEHKINILKKKLQHQPVKF